MRRARESTSSTRDLYQRGQEAMNSGHAVRALRDFNRAERSIRGLNTSASAR